MNSYNLNSDFEIEVTYLTCTNPRFYSRIGKDLLPEMLSNKLNQLLVQAAQDIASNLNRGPRKPSAIINRIRAQAKAWKLTTERITELQAQLDKVVEFCELTEPDLEETVTVLTPAVEDQKLDSAEQAMFRASARGGDIEAVITELRAAQNVGTESVEDAVSLGGSLDEDNDIDPRLARKMSSGIPAIDALFPEGLQCGTLNLVVGDTGGGKTQCFSQLTAFAALDGRAGLFITIEMAAQLVDYRITAAITDVPEVEIRNNLGEARQTARDRLRDLTLGAVKVVRMKGQPDMSSVKQLVREHENDIGRQIDFLIVDYLDLMEASGKKGNALWVKNKLITREMDDYAEEKGIWIWSGTQTQEKEENKNQTRAKGVLDMAGGKEQSRGAALVVGLNVSVNRETIWMNIIKNRFGETGLTTSDESTQFDFGRLTEPTISWAVRDQILTPSLFGGDSERE